MSCPRFRQSTLVALSLAVFVALTWTAWSLRGASAGHATSPVARPESVATLDSQTATEAMRSDSNVASATDEAMRARLRESYGQLPLQFEPNVGQTAEGVDFISRGSNFGLFLSGDEAVFTLRRNQADTSKASQTASLSRPVNQPASSRTVVLRMKLAGARPLAKASGVEELPGKVNYLRGDDASQWRTDVPTFGGVKYEGVYEGVDLVYYGNKRQLEYDFRLAPDANARQIKLRFDGQQRLSVDARGELVIRADGGEIRQRKPFAYQEDASGNRTVVAARYVLKNRNEVGFEIGQYDTSAPLVIDPVLAYSTYLGGGSSDSGQGIEVDADGNAYVVGNTVSTDFPITPGAFQTVKSGVTDVFVTKLNPAGSALVYSTFLGGATNDNGRDIFVDAAGNAYVTGATNSSNFPTTPGAYQRTKSGTYSFDNNIFITKLNPTGSALLYSTYIGPQTSSASANNIVVDASGNAYVTGSTDSTTYPTTPGAPQSVYGGGTGDAFVTKLNATGSALVYSTYLGGSTGDTGNGITLDAANNAYVAGTSNSPNFPTTPGAFQTTNAGGNTDRAFVSKLNTTGTALVYSTYLGGSYLDYGNAVAVDASGSAYVTGYTGSGNFPVTANAFQPALAMPCVGCGGYDLFVTKLNPAGSALVYSTYIGGASGIDIGEDIKLDAQNNVCLVGESNAGNYPTTPDAFRRSPVQGYDAIVTKLNTTGTALLYSTYIGGVGSNDVGAAIAVDGLGNLYITGTAVKDWPVTPGAFMTTDKIETEAYVSKFDLNQGYELSATPAGRAVAPGASTTFNVNVTGKGGFNGIVSLGISGLPAGATASFNPGGVVGSGTATLTINAGANTVQDTYALAITGASTFGPAVKTYATLVVASSRPPVAYNVTDLGTLGGASSRAEDINASGQVAGSSTTERNFTHGFVFNGGTLQDTGTLGGFDAYAYAINASGDAVGYSTLASGGGERPFVYHTSTGQLVQIGALSNLDYDYVDHSAYDINNAGDIVGMSKVQDVQGVNSHAFVYRNGAMTDLTPGRESVATAINNSGVIAGYWRTGAPYHATIFNGGTVTDIGTLTGDTNFDSFAWDINDAGQVVGSSRYDAGYTWNHAFLYQNGVMSDLGSLGGLESIARSINSTGVIVGYSDDANSSDVGAYGYGRDRRAFIYRNGVMTNLNTLVDPASGWVLIEAQSINDAGQIVGQGTINGATHAYLLTPAAT
ncbi:MAG: SBBP repeat-containing protein, partial [Pyrinomonadaceae bacterium]